MKTDQAQTPLPRFRTIRRTSEREFLGLPWLAIAVGPDAARGERRGHARGVVAIGDVATGVIAIGGIARGVIALGGLAFGGGALGGIAIGGGALGIVAIGGAAAGHYASGGAALGTYTMSPLGQDPEAVRFFGSFGGLLR